VGSGEGGVWNSDWGRTFEYSDATVVPAMIGARSASKELSLQTALGRRVRQQRAAAEWIGKVITRIGKAAGVAVRPAAGDDDGKWASAHDLRRSCAERLVAAGVPEREVARVLRHASVETTRKHYAPGNVQESASIIRRRLATPTSPQTEELSVG